MKKVVDIESRVVSVVVTCLAAMWLGATACAHDPGGSSADDERSTDVRSRLVDGKLPIGINLGVMCAMNRELVFVDGMKMATRWFYVDEIEARGRPPGIGGPRSHEGLLPVPTDAHGWPLPENGRPVMSYLLRDMDGHYPTGTWVCTWEGEGEITFGGPARVTARGDHRLEVNVTSSRRYTTLTVTKVDPEDPVRNIRFLMPGFEEAESPFNPRALERLKPFQVIRFYPWQKPQHATGRWEDRATLETAVQTGGNGVAVEYMVDLCNVLGARPWFTMPHLADDEYVRNFAALVKERLDPELSMYVEFSNEVWNTDFPQTRWALAQARELGIRAPEITAREAARDFRIWHDVFGDEKERAIRVAAGHLHNPFVLQVMVEALGDEVDAIAIGAYFGLKAKDEGFDADTPADEILAAARRNLEGLVMERLRQHRMIANRHGEKIGRHVPVIAYEGGQHIVPRRVLTPGRGGLALSPEAVIAAQKLPAMYDAYRTLLEKSPEAGLELFVAYSFVGGYNASSTFGHLEYLDQPFEQAPKFRALVEDWIE